MGTTVIIKSGKLKYIWVTLIPMVFMFVTTFTASFESAAAFWSESSKTARAIESFTLKLDASLVTLMAVLAAIALADMLYKWYGFLTGSREIITSEVIDEHGQL